MRTSATTYFDPLRALAWKWSICSARHRTSKEPWPAARFTSSKLGRKWVFETTPSLLDEFRLREERAVVTPRIRIGNQTAISCTNFREPFEFALQHGFDAFEWFADKKRNDDGSTSGWDEDDVDAAARERIRAEGAAHDVRFTLHAPWQANPLNAAGIPLLIRSIDFARSIDADLVNLHLYVEEGPRAYALALQPVLRHAAEVGLRISIENTPDTTPDDFNETFACLRQLSAVPRETVGMCLDIGHANLCAATPNDFVRYLDALAPEVPIVHAHLHENYGDADSHLTLFTGPSRKDDSGVRAFLDRLRRRGYQGVLILEQWPHPPQLLVEAATRLRQLLARGKEDKLDKPCL
jgi:sugar phosphate isomerase/epimerase